MSARRPGSGLDAAARERLLGQIAESDRVVGGEGDSSDPVSRRRVVEALDVKGRALARLGRYEESAAVWDEIVCRCVRERSDGDALFIARARLNEGLALALAGRHEAAAVALDDVLERCGHEEEIEEVRLMVGRALSAKSGAMSRLRRFDAASAVDWEIVRSFDAAAEAELRIRVAVALMRRAWWLLVEHRVDEALEVGDRLRERFRAETEADAQTRLGDILLRHTRAVLMVGSLSLDSVAISVVVVLAGAVGEGAKVVGRRLRLDPTGSTEAWLKRSSVISGLERAVRRRAPAFFTERRKRAAQARAATDVLIEGFGDRAGHDQERIVATARIYSAAAAMLLGHVVEAYRSFDALARSGQEAVAEAFRVQAANVTTDAGVLAEFGAVGNLAQRARTLGQGDPRITRIAFEESVRAGQPGSPVSRGGRWLARLLAPGKG